MIMLVVKSAPFVFLLLFFFFSCLLDFLGWDPVVLRNCERDYVDGFGW